jgi:hypothetical protein
MSCHLTIFWFLCPNFFRATAFTLHLRFSVLRTVCVKLHAIHVHFVNLYPKKKQNSIDFTPSCSKFKKSGVVKLQEALHVDARSTRFFMNKEQVMYVWHTKLNVTKNELGPTEVGCSIRLDQSVQNQVMGVYIINKHSFYDRVTIKWVNFDFF